MSEIQHTSTPYVFGQTGDADQRGDMLIMADLGNGRIESIGRLVNSHRKAIANAAFICRACNAHDELVAACRPIITWLPLIKQNYPEMISLIHGMERARTALAKLEKEGS